jgi:cell division protein ZipA
VVDLESAIGTPADGAALLVVDSVTLSDDLSRAQSPFAPAPPETPEAAPAWVEPVAAATVDAAPAPQTAPQVESERRIVALRVVARNGERFTGTSVRQALQGEGFVHGDMQIFHRTAGDGRALLSAASLTRPGSFDLATMDAALYRGLNLFAVLPGPLPARDTVDKLLLSGHTLAQRLRGDLLDSRGEPLTESRLAEMRREAAAADPG